MASNYQDRPNILMIGQPNIGKSVMFNHLTGLNISVANYVGTTVEFTAGEIKLGDHRANLIDVPGTYTLEINNEAERVAVEMLQGRISSKKINSCHEDAGIEDFTINHRPEAVISVIDAHNLESSLYLFFQVLEYGIPTIAVLNRMDLIEDRGEKIDVELLSQRLGVPVIPTVAVDKKGVNTVKETLEQMLFTGASSDGEQVHIEEKSEVQEDLWKKAEKITQEVKTKPKTEKKTKRQIWGERLVKPWPGLPLAGIILMAVFGIVVGVGMGLRRFILLPLFRGLIIPAISSVIELVVPQGFILEVLIGEYGIFVKGLEWPFTLVLPYVISFYIALSILEDCGYLPRLGALLDGLLNKLGLPGSSMVPLLLGYGCGIPAIMATRQLSTRKERITVSTMVCLGIPCVAQTGAFISLLAERSILALLMIFIFSFFVIFLAGLILDKLLPGSRPHTIIEIPELLLPKGEVIFKKVWSKVKNYLDEGALPMMAIVGVAAVLYESGIMEFIGELFSPLVVNWLGLPAEASVPLILGVLRRELTVVPLVEMDLTMLQLFTASVVGLLYVPCVAILATLAREFNLKMTAVILVLTSTLAFLVGGIIIRIGGLFV
ncbi:ferrous iron transporter B [Serpentinicella sp. ANB-PHB4]|uniref:ferrous iron transporter B n=1 Tax=Serpentinicella sp. ANB-PHB4 TaxID=3074076 RepID=UPI002858FA20|nr:ferrous iron transporter B [Serpentinicella sp. ANB-PHB4]MDR5658555.1 ferrous iron transporter B [Serpentinicella sp. ANB-PHB4]